MARASRSWGHAAWRLTDRQIDRAARWGRVCAAAPKCQDPQTGVISWRYVTGQRGRVSDTERGACDTHLARFAAKHQLEVAAAPEQEPAERGGIIAAAVAGWNAAPEWVRVEPYGRSRTEWLITRTYRDGLSVSASPVWLRDVPAGASVEQALPEVEAYLAHEWGIAPARPWQFRQGGAHAPVVQVELTEPWVHMPWQVVVAVDRRGVWQAVAVLDPRFRPHTTGLGDTNMTLARAVQAATIELEDGWDLGEWTIHDQHATTTATRKITANV